jgi:predicted RNA-binding Zn-ribbon protein involved in translation (DUF1610 family)
MKAMRNMYCTGCLRTQAFLDRLSHYVCSGCGKRFDKVQRPSDPRPPVQVQVA